LTSRTQIWNSGGGTQSTAIAALIVQGRLPKPDIAVIADTERERSTTWNYLDQVVLPALQSVGVDLVRVPKSAYSDKDLLGGAAGDTLLIPAFTDKGNDIGKLRTFCSAEWKRDVVRRYCTTVHGVKAATNWIGYSTDELGRALKAQAATKNQGKWQVDFPLIRLGLSRSNCIALVEGMGWPTPPRSSCWMCPNHHMNEWREIKADPRDWAKVVQFDRELRQLDANAWLTDQPLPIEQVDFHDSQEVLFGREDGSCESGMCFL